MNKYINIIISIFIISVILFFICTFLKINNLNNKIAIYDNNFKALNLENDSLSKEVLAYRFNVEQLEYLNDSIIKDLNLARKELGIKDKQLKQLQSIKIETSTKDSIFVRDTIFKENFIKLDTLLGDDWYKVKLELEYPNKIKVDTKYTSNLNVFAYSSKEIVGTPKKCWLGRLFQKKQNVIRVEAHDTNPHATIKETKFIIIE